MKSMNNKMKKKTSVTKKLLCDMRDHLEVLNIALAFFLFFGLCKML